MPPALLHTVDDHGHNLQTVNVAFPTNEYITVSLTGINLKQKKKKRQKKTPTKNIKLRGGNLTLLFNSEAF